MDCENQITHTVEDDTDTGIIRQLRLINGSSTKT